MTRLRLVVAFLAGTLAACGSAPSLPDAPPIETPSFPSGGEPEPDPVLPPAPEGLREDLPGPVAWSPLQERLEALKLTFPPSTADVVYVLWSKEWAPGRLLLDGAWHDVDLRQRGDGAREHPKHSWKTRHPAGQWRDGPAGSGAWPARTRNYLAEWPDGGYLSDPFSYGLLRSAGVRSPRWRYVTLDVNGEHQGIYVEVQEADDRYFLLDQGFDPESNVYRCGLRDCEMKLAPPASYQGPWEKGTNETEPSDDLQAFLRELNRTPEHELLAWLEERLDLPRFVRMYAVGILVSWSGVDDSGSYLVHDRATGKWSFVPWDLNNARLVYWRVNPAEWSLEWRNAIPFYTLYDPATLGVAAGKSARYGVEAHPPFVVLFQRAWDLPALRNRILDEVEAMLDGVFAPGQVRPRVEALRALIEAPLARDPWVSREHEAASVEKLLQYVERRTAFLRAQIPAERRRGEGGLVLNAVAPASVELYNGGDAPRALAGLTLTPDLRKRLLGPLPDVVVPPGGKVTIPLGAGADGGELGLFDAATRLPLDAIFYAPLEGRTYARIPDGAETWGWR